MGASGRKVKSSKSKNLGPVHNVSITSIEVAKHAGVSQSTVARVFARPELVSAATRQEVIRVAESLGYLPSAIAAGMRNQRSGLIGVVVPSYGEYWQGVISEFSRQINNDSRQLLLTTFRDAQGVEGAIQSISRYRLDGLVLASSTIGVGQISRLINSSMPVVAFNQPDAANIAPQVVVDNQHGATDIAMHLIECGVKSVAFVGGIAQASTDKLRYRGAVEAFSAQGISCPYIQAGAFSYDAGFKIGAMAAVGNQLPDAFMVAADEIAFGVLDGLRKRGVRVPEDVLVTGFDGVPQSFWEGYDLTTLAQPIELMVTGALKLLVEKNSTDSVIVEGELRIGNTTKVRNNHG